MFTRAIYLTKADLKQHIFGTSEQLSARPFAYYTASLTERSGSIMTGQAARKITLENGRQLDYILDCKQRKNMYISIRDGKVTLKIPPSVSLSQAERFLLDKSDWIEKNLSDSGIRPCKPEKYENGEHFRLAGNDYTITLKTASKYFQPHFENDKLIIAVRNQPDSDYIKAQFDKAIILKSSEIISGSVKRLSALTGLIPAKVTVKRLSGSWGRCSSEGNISINMNIVFYDSEYIDYIIIHELCHLRYMDHSKDFWLLVEKYCPDWKRIRSQMK